MTWQLGIEPVMDFKIVEEILPMLAVPVRNIEPQALDARVVDTPAPNI